MAGVGGRRGGREGVSGSPIVSLSRFESFMACGRTIRNFGLRLHYIWRGAQAVVGLGLLIGALAAPSAAAPPVPAPTAVAPLKTTVAVTAKDGYARLVFAASEYLEATARVSGNVLIITFKQPIDISVDRVPGRARRLHRRGAARS